MTGAVSDHGIPARDHIDLVVRGAGRLGVKGEIVTGAAAVELPRFPERADDAHKGDVGRVVVVGGRMDEVGMVGAPALAANAAFRAGVGLVQILTTAGAQRAVSVLAPCATTRLLDASEPESVDLARMAQEFHANVVAVGPGLSPAIEGGHILTLMNTFTGGVVVDADGLNALAAVGRWCAPCEGQVVVTPHSGEMRRIVAGLGMGGKLKAESRKPKADYRKQKTENGMSQEAGARKRIAEAVANETRAVVVLKGAGTVVSDGSRTYVNRTGHSGMATGGAGDVLTGVIAALMGQKMAAFEAAVLGVHLHGRAGELAGERVGRVSVTAVDLVDSLGEAIESVRAGR